MSWRTISIDEFDRIIPVKPPKVNKKTKPSLHKRGADHLISEKQRVANQLKILIPVGTPITIVAAVK